jgi:hypothetical protein
MKKERRGEARWRASEKDYTVRVRHADGKRSEARLVDVSSGGMGLRADRQRFSLSSHIVVELDVNGSTFEVPATVRFVDQYYPRIGIQASVPHAMKALVEQVELSDFLKLEYRGDTVAVYGSLTYRVLRDLEEAARGCQKLDLSNVSSLSMAAIGLLSKVAKSGIKLESCSEAIAPHLERRGFCVSRACGMAGSCRPGQGEPAPARLAMPRRADAMGDRHAAHRHEARATRSA